MKTSQSFLCMLSQTLSTCTIDWDLLPAQMASKAWHFRSPANLAKHSWSKLQHQQLQHDRYSMSFEKCRLLMCSFRFDQTILHDVPVFASVSVYEGRIVATIVSEADLCLKECCSLGKQTLHHMLICSSLSHIVSFRRITMLIFCTVVV